jgi:glyoxylate/hydroxypyruvate reductase A
MRHSAVPFAGPATTSVTPAAPATLGGVSILFVADLEPAERDLWIVALRAVLAPEVLLEASAPVCDAKQLAAVDVAIVANPPPGSLAALPNLKLVQSLWAGVDRLLADPTLPPGVPLARMVDPVMNDAIAQTALWAVLSLHRGFFRYARQQHARRWQPHAQRRADELPVAVLGLGQMGSTVARRLATNGYPVAGWSVRPHALPGVATQSGDEALPTVLAGAQVVVNLLPLTSATHGLFNAATFARMADGASLINLARGGHVVESDLLAALDSNRLHHAVLDVFSVEPLPPGHPFWSHSRVTVLPHVAAQTDRRSAAEVAARNVRALRDGRPIEHLVDRARGY